MYTSLRLKIGRFFRKYKKIILIIAIVWFVMWTINYYLKNRTIEVTPSTTYKPHVSVMDSGSEVPEKYQEKIETLVDKFMEYCNSKDYENAFNLLRQDCRDEMFGTIENFKEYVDKRFPNKKLYSIQSYSNFDDMNIYQVKIFDDYLANGVTNTTYKYGEEKFALVPNDDGELELSVGDFIKKVDIKNIAEDKYLKIDIKNKIVKYEFEEYTVKITNRSEYTVVLLNNYSSVAEEIVLELENDNREIEDFSSEVILLAGQSREYTFKFAKYYDESNEAKSLVFDAIRILPKYSGIPENEQVELDNAISKYSLKVPVY